MHRNSRIPTFPAALLIVIAATSSGCSDSECYQNRTALPLAGFYEWPDGTDRIHISGLQVKGIGVPGDSLLWDGAPCDHLYLPFRIDSDTTAYTFTYAVTDSIGMPTRILESTVTFIYTKTPHLVSEACGVSYRFDIQDIVCRGNLIEKAEAPRGFIDNADKENLRIYFTKASTGK